MIPTRLRLRPAVGKFGTEVFSANALNAEALYVMLEYEIGPSGFEGKVVDEFTAMTEFYVGAFEAFVPVDDTVVADDEAKTLMMDDKTTVADLLAAIGDSEGKLYSVTDSKGSKLSADALVGTGAVVTELVSGAAEKYTAIVRGDVNGDGASSRPPITCWSRRPFSSSISWRACIWRLPLASTARMV